MSEMRDLCLAACTIRKIGSVRKQATAILAANLSFRSVSHPTMRFEIQRHMQRVMRTLGTMVAFAGCNSDRLGRSDQNDARFHQKIRDVICEL